MRRAARIDDNQGAIITALRSAGATVQPLHTVGGGVPDLLVGFMGQTFLYEIKDGAKVKSKQALTPDQEAWHAAWTGSPVYIVRDVTGAVDALLKGRNA